MELKINVSGRTDVGLVRPGNEDYLFIDKNNHVYAVCDGMGGHKAGEVASMLAAETLDTTYNHFSKQLQGAPNLKLSRTLPDTGDLLVKAIQIANRAIYSGALKDESKSGMGTTIVATAFEADILCLAHVGDSRAYRLDQDKLVPLTSDHSWLEELKKTEGVTKNEANSFVGKNVITRALGVKETVDIDFRILKAKPGDIFILCSDGLCGFVEDEDIFDAARDYRDDLDEIVSQLIQMANDRGGSDNVTVIAMKVESVKESPLPELEVITISDTNTERSTVIEGWVTRFAEHRQKTGDTNDSQDTSSSGKSKPGMVGLLALFLSFIVVAIAIIYFTVFMNK